jgi:hypothetical protein
MTYIARSLEGMAVVEAATGSPQRAMTLAGAAAGHRDRSGTINSPTDQMQLQARLQPVRHALTVDEQAVAWREGHGMSSDQAIAYATHRSFKGRRTKTDHARSRYSAPLWIDALIELAASLIELTVAAARRPHSWHPTLSVVPQHRQWPRPDSRVRDQVDVVVYTATARLIEIGGHSVASEPRIPANTGRPRAPNTPYETA